MFVCPDLKGRGFSRAARSRKGIGLQALRDDGSRSG
jgi:hypothetical protein